MPNEGESRFAGDRTAKRNMGSELHQESIKLVSKDKSCFKRTVSILATSKRQSWQALNKKSEEFLTILSKMPIKDKHLTTAEIKCFMMGKHTHDSHLLDKKLSANAIEKIKASSRLQQNYSFKYTSFVIFGDCILKKCGDSEVVLSTFEACMKDNYPPTVEMMLSYLGVFLYSYNAQYEQAENYCQKLFDLIVRYKIEEFFVIYLILKIKIKTNLCEWAEAIPILTKLLYFSWMFNLQDLEIWCYFELSRAFFFLQLSRESEIFKIKSEANSFEPKRSIYREVAISNLILEIESIWQGQINFNFESGIDFSRLVIPENNRYGVEEYIADQRRLKTSIKSIIENCKIRHVGNLLTRISDIGMHTMQKENSMMSSAGFESGYGSTKMFSSNSTTNSLSSHALQSNCMNKSGNNFLLTHQSFNKNMNMFFRRRGKQNEAQRVFYTIENSQKSWGALKEMLKNIFIEMSDYTESSNL